MSANPYQPGTADFYRYQVQSTKKNPDQQAQEDAEKKLAAETFQEAQKQAQQQAIKTGNSQNVSDYVPQARQQVEDKYTTSITPGYSLLGGGSKVEVPEQRTLSVPVPNRQGQAEALRENYGQLQKINQQAGNYFNKNAFGSMSIAEARSAFESAKNRPEEQVTYHKHVTVELNDTLGLNPPPTKAPEKQPEYPHEEFEPNIPEQIWRGTVGHIGEFVSGIFDFNAKHTTGDYSLGAGKASRDVRDATGLEGLGSVYDALGSLTGNQSYKDYAAHAKHEAQLERGEASGGALSELMAIGQEKTGYAADENTAANVAALEKQRQDRPLEYAIATFTDVLPIIAGIGGKGASPKNVTVKKTGGGIVQRAYADENLPETTSNKPSSSASPGKGFVDPFKAKEVSADATLPSDVLKIGNEETTFKVNTPKTPKPPSRDSVDFFARAKLVDENATLPSDVLRIAPTEEGGLKGGLAKPTKPSKPDEPPSTSTSNNGLLQILEKPTEETTTTAATSETSVTASQINSDLMAAETVDLDALQVSGSTLGLGNSDIIVGERLAAKNKPPKQSQWQDTLLGQLQKAGSKQKNDVFTSLRNMGKTTQSAKQRQSELLQRQQGFMTLTKQAQKPKLTSMNVVGVSSAGLLGSSGGSKTTTKTSQKQREDTFEIPQLVTDTIPTQGSRTRTHTTPRFTPDTTTDLLSIPTLKPNITTDIINIPPPSRPPTRTPPSEPPIRIPPRKPPMPNDDDSSTRGLIDLNDLGGTNLKKYGVYNILAPSFSLNRKGQFVTPKGRGIKIGLDVGLETKKGRKGKRKKSFLDF